MKWFGWSIFALVLATGPAGWTAQKVQPTAAKVVESATATVPGATAVPTVQPTRNHMRPAEAQPVEASLVALTELPYGSQKTPDTTEEMLRVHKLECDRQRLELAQVGAQTTAPAAGRPTSTIAVAKRIIRTPTPVPNVAIILTSTPQSTPATIRQATFATLQLGPTGHEQAMAQEQN